MFYLDFIKDDIVFNIFSYYSWHSDNSYIKRRKKVYFYIAIFLSSIVYIIGTHIILMSTKKEENLFLVKESYVSSDYLYKIKLNNTEYGIYPTNYYYNKRSSLIAFIQSSGWGVGVCNYNSFIGKLQERNLHPPSFPKWDPHSTYFGSLAELGVIGFIEIILFLVFTRRIFIEINSRLIEDNQFLILKYSLSGSFIAIAIEAIATDIMNKRHYWVLLAITRSIICFLPHKEAALEK